MGIRRKKTILEQAADYVEAAVDKAGPVLAEAKDRAGTALAEARDQAGPVLADARDKAAPLVAQAADFTADKASQGKELASAKAAELTGKPQKKKHRLRKLLLIGGIVAALGFVAKKLTSGGDQENWQSSPTPPPPPRPAPAPAEDSAGSGPDEALADASEESHEVTTPDEPAEVVDVAPGEEPSEDSAKP
jgi:ElaB/YqjD/DUF883 family membrane-anchored ribosome-binding protein